jgi:hypothetical protein
MTQAQSVNLPQPLDAAEQCVQTALAECERLASRLSEFVRVADASLAALSPEKRALYEPLVARFKVYRRSREAKLNDNVIQLFGERRELTTPQVIGGLIRQGIPVDQKQVHNALDYLTRRGRLKRISPGRYYCIDEGIIVETTDSLFGEPT